QVGEGAGALPQLRGALSQAAKHRGSEEADRFAAGGGRGAGEDQDRAADRHGGAQALAARYDTATDTATSRGRAASICGEARAQAAGEADLEERVVLGRGRRRRRRRRRRRWVGGRLGLVDDPVGDQQRLRSRLARTAGALVRRALGVLVLLAGCSSTESPP